VAGASETTERVAYVNGNWTAGSDGENGSFELLIVTEGETRHALRVTSEDMGGVVALIRTSNVLLWDPQARTLIAANLAGEWIQRSWSAGDQRQVGPPH
jgi:hypothetical protein